MFEIGQKVVPIDKTKSCSLEESPCWARALTEGKNYLYYKGICSMTGYHSCSDTHHGGGDYFNLSDLIAYEEPVEKDTTPRIKLHSYFVIRCNVDIECQNRIDSVSKTFETYPTEKQIEDHMIDMEFMGFRVHYAYVEKRFKRVKA